MSTKKLDKRKAETLINSMFPFFKPERETGLEDWSNSQTLINRRFAGLSFSSVPLVVPP